ncbi:GIN domain-containing protein [Empedobacter brevis]|uniref:GIN domain-containing protein n=1 Tax=Empedobacter brevis TaxID=247 RepID=UPI00333F7AC9
MKNYMFLLFSLVTILLNAQITESRNVSTFNKIIGKSGVNIIYYNSDSPKVIVETDKRENLNYIITAVKNNTLEIAVDTKNQRDITIAKIDIKVYGPSLTKVSMSAGARISFEDKMKTNQLEIKQTSGAQVVFKDIKANGIEINLSSGAQLNGNFSSTAISSKMSSGAVWSSKINSEYTTINISSGAKATLKGETEQLAIKATSGSHSDLKNVKTTEAKLVASNASSITSWVSQKLLVDANTASNVTIKGLPTDLTVQRDKLSKVLNENGDVY